MSAGQHPQVIQPAVTGRTEPTVPPIRSEAGSPATNVPNVRDLTDGSWQRTCFYSTPIGEPGSDERRHADVFLDSLITPAVEKLDPTMCVVRADQLSSSLITDAVYEHVANARLLIADLSFHNANVLHEVGVRHAIDKPCVLISRAEDPIPANLQNVRMVRMKTSGIWDFVPRIESYRSEIEDYARSALSGEGPSSSPVPKP